VWPGLFHVFQMVRPLPEAREALADVARFVRGVEAAQPRRLPGVAAS
jgi:acetyl esterase/lipase